MNTSQYNTDSDVDSTALDEEGPTEAEDKYSDTAKFSKSGDPHSKSDGNVDNVRAQTSTEVEEVKFLLLKKTTVVHIRIFTGGTCFAN